MVNPQLDEKFDTATVFFGGFGYILSDSQVVEFLQNIHQTVKPEGFLFLEFWDSLAVKPNSEHYLVAENEKIKVVRVNPSHYDASTGILTMPMLCFVFRYNHFHEEFTELHKIRSYSMSYFSCLVKNLPWGLNRIFAGSYQSLPQKAPPTKDDFRINAVLTH